MRTRQNRKKYKKRNKIQLNKECENISLDEKTSKTYLEKIEKDFVAMNERFDEKPSTMLLFGVVFAAEYGLTFFPYKYYGMYDEGTTFFLNILYIPMLFGLIYYFSAKLYTTKKVFPIVLCINFSFSLFYFNVIDCSWAYAYFHECPEEWYILLPIVIFKAITLVWFFFQGYYIKEENPR